ncbi:hypothetical protein WJX84_002062 [Apatococcus fuscideae]|uniref:NFACT RNA-binding domain-containing protein n=1 Tax=Apatococcus fuscideae TaxID=2026836 RepID=A0AAW1SN39_9CHLO
MDTAQLMACAQELQAGWVPAKVEQILQTDEQTICMRLRTVSASGWLHISWHPTSFHLCMGPPPVRGAASEAFSFGEQLGGSLRGLVLLQAGLPQPWERVVALGLSSRPSDPISHTLYFEAMGRYSNVLLVDQDSGKIKAAGRQIGGSQSRLRQLQVGGSYHLPPPAPGLDPGQPRSEADWVDIVTKTTEQLGDQKGRAASWQQGLVRAFQGVSPGLVKDLAARAGVDAAAPPAQLDQAAWQELHSAWSAWLSAILTGRYIPYLDLASGQISVLGPPGTRSVPQNPSDEMRSSATPADSTSSADMAALNGTSPNSQQQDEDQGGGSIHALVDGYFRGRQADEGWGRLQQRLNKALNTALKKLEGRLTSLKQQADTGRQADATQRSADLLMANAFRYEEEGTRELDLEDWDTGSLRTIVLDEGKSAVETAEGWYGRARKQRRAGKSLEPLISAAQGDIAYLQEVQASLEQLQGDREGTSNPDLAALQGIQDELVAGRFMKAPADAALAAKGAAKGRKAQKRSGSAAAGLDRFRRFTSPSGLTVLVGRNNIQNDELSHRVAKDGDIWMHVRGFPGAHTLLQVPSGSEAAEEDVQCAADLAAFFSKARPEGRAPVIVASPSDLHRPKGSRPGQVMVKKERVEYGRPDKSLAAAAAAAAAP